MRAAVFLDRDNTLIHNDGDLGDPELVRLIQGAAAAVASLRGLNYHIIVVTNQGGVARGAMTEEDVDLVNQRINEMVLENCDASIDRFYYCPFHPEGTIEDYRKEHPWRKPAPGMIQQAARDLNLDLNRSWMVGDQLRDVQSGKAAGVRTILLTDQVGSTAPLKQREQAAAAFSGQEGQGPDTQVIPDFVARNLIEAVRLIAQQRKPDLAEEAKAAAARRIDLRGLHQATETTQIADDAPEPPDQSTPAPQPPTESEPPAPEPPAEPPEKPQSRSATQAPEQVVAVSSSATSESGQTDSQDAGNSKSEESQPSPDDSPEELSAAASQENSDNKSKAAPSKADSHTSKEKGFGIQILAAVLQLVAVACLVAGYFLGDTNILVFVKWLGAAMAAEMIVISLLILRR
jgi:D,D-heptose 1,7-bisphosphate phosphatase